MADYHLVSPPQYQRKFLRVARNERQGRMYKRKSYVMLHLYQMFEK